MIATLISKYDISFGAGDSGTSLFRDEVDNFVCVPGALNLVFEKRLGK